MSISIRQWFHENSARLSGEILFDEPLSRHTYYRIGGPATVLAVPKSRSDVDVIAQGIELTQAPVFILGAGSNVLVSDEGFPGIVVKTGKLNLEITVRESDPRFPQRLRLRTGGSVALSSLLRKASHEGWGGLERLAGIPGTVGGAVAMNAGTHLGEVKDFLSMVEVISLVDRTITVFEGERLRFDYRKNCFLQKGAIIWAAEWHVQSNDPVKVRAKIDEVLARRKATQPVDLPSCGSVFKNPKASGLSAWQVIDRLGLRGHRVGDAQFSEKHSNFIVNLDRAKATDVKSLIELAVTRAKTELGIELEREVIFIDQAD